MGLTDMTLQIQQDKFAAEREVRRLREALKRIAALGDTDGPAAPLLVQAGDIAKAALDERI